MIGSVRRSFAGSLKICRRESRHREAAHRSGARRWGEAGLEINVEVLPKHVRQRACCRRGNDCVAFAQSEAKRPGQSNPVKPSQTKEGGLTGFMTGSQESEQIKGGRLCGLRCGSWRSGAPSLCFPLFVKASQICLKFGRCGSNALPIDGRGRCRRNNIRVGPHCAVCGLRRRKYVVRLIYRWQIIFACSKTRMRQFPKWRRIFWRGIFCCGSRFFPPPA